MNRYITLACALLATAGMTACTVRDRDGQHATGKTGKTGDAEPKQGYYGYVEFYEGYNGNDDVFCRRNITSRPFELTLKMSECGKNDEAKSMRFHETPASTYVAVYDNPNCTTGDDYAEINTLRVATRDRPITVWNFEDNDSDDPTGYRIKYHYQDGNLDGKVSCVKIKVP